MCLGTFWRLRRSLATSSLYAAVRILPEAFRIIGNAISYYTKKRLRMIYTQTPCILYKLLRTHAIPCSLHQFHHITEQYYYHQYHQCHQSNKMYHSFFFRVDTLSTNQLQNQKYQTSTIQRRQWKQVHHSQVG